MLAPVAAAWVRERLWGTTLLDPVTQGLACWILSEMKRMKAERRIRLPAGSGGVDVLVYTPQEFATMRRDGNAFAEMIAEEGRLIYAGHAKG